MKARVRIPVDASRGGADLASTDAEYREYLVGLAEGEAGRAAAERGRKVSARPEFVGIETTPLTEAIVYFVFEVNTIPA